MEPFSQVSAYFFNVPFPGKTFGVNLIMSKLQPNLNFTIHCCWCCWPFYKNLEFSLTHSLTHSSVKFQWRPYNYKPQSLLQSLQSVLANRTRLPLSHLLRRWFPSLLSRRRLTGNALAGDSPAELWFSRPYKELPPPMPRKWRGFPLKNPFFSPWVFHFF